MNLNTNPFNVRLVDVVITKFNGTERLSIVPQVVEFVVYQSVFSPVMKASLVVNDYINLLNNYPLVGEETVEVTVTQLSDQGENFELMFKMEYVISAIKDISVNSTNRQLVYVIDLVSKEAFNNAKTRISKAYSTNIEEMIVDVAKKYLKTDKEINVIGNTKKSRNLIIPNLAPFNALAWLSKFAISEDPAKYYTYCFFEHFIQQKVTTGFTFKPLQRNTWRGAVDQLARTAAKDNPYFYVSNIEIIKNNKQAFLNLVSKGYSEDRSILSLKFNKRYSTLEKIIGGYFENEFVEINLLQKDHKITRKTIKDNTNTLEAGKQNTDQYIDDVINHDIRSETSGRIKYLINNYDDINQPSFRDKFGQHAISYLAYSQIDLSVGVHTDLLLRPGDLFYADIPEFHGFEDVRTDDYLTGYFMISEIKNVIRPSGETSTLLRINKDSLSKTIEPRSKYNQGSSPLHGGER